jgi:hypothetical protein
MTEENLLELLKDTHAIYVESLDEYQELKKYSYDKAFQFKREQDKWYLETITIYIDAILILRGCKND